MTCIPIGNGFVCVNSFYRLRLFDGRHIFMIWHDYGGPEIYQDKSCNREILEWYEDPAIVEQIEWFVNRGKRA